MTGGVSPFELTGPLPGGRRAVEASAGTGKTYTLAGLAARYVAEAGVPLNELLIVTFTRAAAAELRDRVRARLVDAAEHLAAVRAGTVGAGDGADALLAHLAGADLDRRLDRLGRAVTDFDAATITTIHGFAQQVLGTLGTAAPGDLDAELVDDTEELVAQVCADLLATEAVLDPDPDGSGALPTPSALAELARHVLDNPGIVLFPDDTDDVPPEIRHRRRLVTSTVAEVHRRRRANGTIAYDDVLTQLRDALAGDTGAAASAALRARFRVALIDEFQDTDPVQWDIFARLFDDAGADGGRVDGGTALVLVGDPKQAIYAFRGANVHTYLEAAHGPGTPRTTLGMNWRSDAGLLRALDVLFEGATFGDERIGFLPVEAAPEHDRTGFRRAGAAAAPLELRVVAHDGIPRDKKGVSKPEDAARAVQTDLADHVENLLTDATVPAGEHGHGPGDGPAGDRRVRPGDIAVLVARHADSADIQSLLTDRGIPAVITRGDSVLASPAATQWRWLLQGMARPSDPAAARTVALSWFLGWAATDLATLDEHDEQLGSVQARLYEWSDTLAAHGVTELCRRVWADTDVTGRVLATRSGDRDLTDLDHIAELLQAAAGPRRMGAPALLALLDQLTAEHAEIDPDTDVAARRVESDDDAVQIMTIYAAKGLEFPVVLVPGLWRPPNGGSPIFSDPDRGARTLDLTKGTPWPDRAAANRRKALTEAERRGEALRLLYVALTRARHHTAVWWAPSSRSAKSGLARLLFARSEGRLDPELFAAASVALPEPADQASSLAPLVDAAGGDLAVHDVQPRSAPARWTDDHEHDTAPDLAVATLGRALDRPRHRWSFTAISSRADLHELDPLDESLGESGAGDEPVPPVEADGPAPPVTDLPLGDVPGGAAFGTLVHEILEDVDFTAPDLDGELTDRVHHRLRWSDWPVEESQLVAGLRAAIATPLGPLFGGRSLRDIAPGDRLDELAFELPLGEAGRRPTDGEIGRLVLAHLRPDDPLAPWATRVAAGAFRVSLAGHLTGSIDAVFRIVGPDGTPRFVVSDYKTNTLSARGRLPTSADYHPTLFPAAMAEHHYPLQALLYAVALHRYLRWRLPAYEPTTHLGGVAYLFLRGMAGPGTPTPGGHPHGVFTWPVPPALVVELSDLLDGRSVDAAATGRVS